jgi:hypothetical protein
MIRKCGLVALPLINAWFISHFHGPFFSHQAQQKTLGVQCQLQVDGDFLGAHYTKGLHSCTLGTTEEGRPRIGMPYHISGPKNNLWRVRGSNTTKRKNALHMGGLEHEGLQREKAPYLKGCPEHNKWQGKRLEEECHSLDETWW